MQYSKDIASTNWKNTYKIHIPTPTPITMGPDPKLDVKRGAI